MRIKFCGANREVTGSSHLLITNDGRRILLDCGMYQGNNPIYEDFNWTWFFDPASIDAVILSHAHIDHSGRLPYLVKSGYKGLIYCTHATRSLCAIMLMDSARIQQYDAIYQSQHSIDETSNRSILPLYNESDVRRCMDKFRTYDYDQWIKLDVGIEVCFTDAGHLLGSAAIQIRTGGRLIGFTGDIGRPNRPILRDPVPLPPMDFLICEATYGDKEHEGSAMEEERFLKIIEETCVKNRGKVIIPAFSVGRTQEIVHLFDRMATAHILPRNIPFYVDSPMAVNATQVYASHSECYDEALKDYLLLDDDPFGFNNLFYIRDVEDSKALNKMDGPAVIISSSGMADAGRIQHHIANHIENPQNTILLVGYATPYTPAGQLANGATSIRLLGENLQVKAKVEKMDGFSGHGDQWEMLNFIKYQQNQKGLFLVHGEYYVQKKWKIFLSERGFQNILIPILGDEYHLLEEGVEIVEK